VADALPEIERLLAVPPDAFVEERKKLAQNLRAEGRGEEAKIIAATKKPSPVVLAVNRAARDRPQAAQDAAAAAERLARAQVSGKPDRYQELVTAMGTASALLADVALANLSKGSVSEAMRRRTAAHIRGALSSAATRDLLVRGVLTEEAESPGFDAFGGVPVPRRKAKPGKDSERDARRKARAREKQLQADIRGVRRDLSDAEQRLSEATRARDTLAARLEELETELAELSGP
jgi:uncharacterized sporulation protein YeaH/YhbH (DUF444 family)